LYYYRSAVLIVILGIFISSRLLVPGCANRNPNCHSNCNPDRYVICTGPNGDTNTDAKHQTNTYFAWGSFFLIIILLHTL
jgi:hypothetical protein